VTACVDNSGGVEKRLLKIYTGDFLGGTVVKSLPANSGDTGLTPGQESETPHAS